MRFHLIVMSSCVMLKLLEIKKSVFAKNDEIAASNRARLAAAGVKKTLNLTSSPGSGKTSLLVETLNRLKSEARFQIRAGVIEGDQHTANDAERIAATGAPALQINTLSACHLDASMIDRALGEFDLDRLDILFIENVGNLVCPAAYDLGESMKVVIMSVTEGEDKPLKYPRMFIEAGALVLTKIDLEEHLDFDSDLAVNNALKVNGALRVFRLSAKSGVGLDEWVDWIAST